MPARFYGKKETEAKFADQIYSVFHPKRDALGYVHGRKEYENGMPSKTTLHIEREYEAFGRSGVGQYVVNGYTIINGKKENIDGTIIDEPVLELLFKVKPYKSTADELESYEITEAHNINIKGAEKPKKKKPQKIEPIDDKEELLHLTRNNIDQSDYTLVMCQKLMNKLNEVISYLNKQNENTQ
jgi:hypothetical protein